MALSLKHVWINLLLHPAHTLPTAAAPIFVAAGLAVHDGTFEAVPTLVAFFGSWLIHVAGVFTDNHELLRRYPAIVEHPDLTEALADGTVTLDQIKLAIAACLVLALPAAIFFLGTGGIPVLALGAVGVVASIGYAAGPMPYARLGLAETVFFTMFGIVGVAGAYYVQVACRLAAAGQATSFAELPVAAFLVGLPVGALVTNVLMIDDLRDRKFDAAKRWRTIAVRFGVHGSRVAYAFMSALAYAAPLVAVATGAFNAWALLPLLTLPWAWSIATTIRTHDDLETLTPMTPRASMLAFTYSAMWGLGLALG